jgi:hypothetical protein
MNSAYLDVSCLPDTLPAKQRLGYTRKEHICPRYADMILFLLAKRSQLYKILAAERAEIMLPFFDDVNAPSAVD